MKRADEMKKAIKDLCERAQVGKLTLDELYDAWPPCADQDSFFSSVFEDIEDAVEHMPGYFFKSGPNLEEWSRLGMSSDIALDILLLERSEDSTQLMQCKQFIHELESIPIALYSQVIDAYFNHFEQR